MQMSNKFIIITHKNAPNASFSEEMFENFWEGWGDIPPTHRFEVFVL